MYNAKIKYEPSWYKSCEILLDVILNKVWKLCYNLIFVESKLLIVFNMNKNNDKINIKNNS